MPDLPDYLLKAYGLFKEEFAKHMKYFSELDTCEASLSENAVEISRRFHTIKGGAGFLEMDRVVELSREGEERFKDFSYSEEMVGSLTSLIEGLKAEEKKFD